MCKFPEKGYLFNPVSRVALCDFLARRLSNYVKSQNYDAPLSQGGGWSSSKGGDIGFEEPSQHIIPRTSVLNAEDGLQIRFTVSLPGQGRSILGQAAAKIFSEKIPALIRDNILEVGEKDHEVLQKHCLSSEQQTFLRKKLSSLELVGFVANGSLLPRESGTSDLPMKEGAILFKSPPELEVTIDLPFSGRSTGMGIKKGVTLIVGGGYHGKTTLLNALEVGIYDHVPGDGREFVAVDENAVKIRSEDGRRIEAVDIRPFINDLPFGKSTANMCTEDASGSTSQAANIMEALEIGASTLLIDEDTCATNFMIRDKRMQMLVPKEKEPITPFLYKVRQLTKDLNISTILVMGSSGDYFDVADTVVLMENYSAKDKTVEALDVANKFATDLRPQKEGGWQEEKKIISRYIYITMKT
eukprot:TRINITY_DN5102_c0_g1_i1.p1 TRINITY_DN5102_c0_g1~~TRINITY_DN5102_c0_g1_i1.p1  ORF type:complete len:414 (-),score=71.74 TRINITY_DN5102_c0_g1_i1:400-1641(-)